MSSVELDDIAMGLSRSFPMKSFACALLVTPSRCGPYLFSKRVLTRSSGSVFASLPDSAPTRSKPAW